MNKTTLGLLGAVSALATAGGAVAATPAVAPAQSFAELLQPIPNAVERLQVSDAELAGQPRLMQAQWGHHHHHNNYHHHHHHSHYWYQSHGYYWFGGRWIFGNHHHHHHHH